jgi:hypothetical protein
LKQDGIAVVRRAHHAVGAKPITEGCSEMIRTGAQYREGLRDGREVWIDGERVKDIASHPATKPIVDIRSRMYDMQHEAAYKCTSGAPRRAPSRCWVTVENHKAS